MIDTIVHIAKRVNGIYAIAMKRNSGIPVAKLLLDAFNWFDMSLLASMKAQNLGDISHSQSMLMAHLTDSGIRISELAKCMRISRQAAQKRVVDLEKLGFVYTDTDPTNLSAKIVSLTPKGRNRVKAALGIFAELELELSKRIGVDEFNCMKEAIKKDWGVPVVLKRDRNKANATG